MNYYNVTIKNNDFQWSRYASDESPKYYPIKMNIVFGIIGTPYSETKSLGECNHRYPVLVNNEYCKLWMDNPDELIYVIGL